MTSLPRSLDRLPKQARFVHLHTKALANKVLGIHESLADEIR